MTGVAGVQARFRMHMGTDAIAVCAFSLLVALLVALLHYVKVEPAFSSAESVADVHDFALFTLMYYLLTAIAFGVSIYFDKEHPVYSVLLLLLYSFAFLNFWVIASPVHLIAESLGHVGDVEYIQRTGSINYSIGYQQYPGIFLFTAMMNALQGVSPALASVEVELFRGALFPLFIYFVILKLVRNSRLAILGSFLCVQSDIMLSAMPAFHPEVFGLLLFLISFIVLAKGRQNRPWGLLLAVAAGSISYALGSILIAAIAVVLWLAGRSGRTESIIVDSKTVTALIVLSAAWNLLSAVVIPGQLGALFTGLGSIFSLKHYFFLSTTAGKYVAGSLLWINLTNLSDLAVLFGAPAAIFLTDLLRRRLMASHLVLIALVPFFLLLTAFTGGAEGERMLYYMAPFATVLLLKCIRRFRASKLLFTVLIGFLIALSLPSLMAFTVNINSESNYVQTLTAADFVVSDFPRGNVQIYDGSGIAGVNSSFSQSHVVALPGTNYYATSSDYLSAVHPLLNQFYEYQGSIWAVSTTEFIGFKHIYGPSGGSLIENLISTELDNSSIIYENGLSTIYS